MNNLFKIAIGSAIAVLVVGLYVNKPKIEVTAEATANATSIVIVPTSTIQTVATDTQETRQDAPQTVYIYNTVRETIKEVTTSTNQPSASQPIVSGSAAGSMIEYVPTPVFTTTMNEPVTAPEPQPVAITEPVAEPVTAPIVEADHFTEFPTVRTEYRTLGDYIFFKASWTGPLKGSVKCNGIYYYKNTVDSGMEAIIQKEWFNGNPGTDVMCEYWVGDLGGTQYSFTTEK